jgi:hypothetical protein
MPILVAWRTRTVAKAALALRARNPLPERFEHLHEFG